MMRISGRNSAIPPGCCACRANARFDKIRLLVVTISAPFFSYADNPPAPVKPASEGKPHQDGQACRGRQAESSFAEEAAPPATAPNTCLGLSYFRRA